jgi:branched-chain amino acid transport system ATP-binding protein
LVFRTDHLTVRYGGALALSDISIEFPDGEMTAVVGRNGAGKSTLLGALAGITKVAAGSIEWPGGEIRTGRSGIGLIRGCRIVPESRNVFADLSVQDNLRSGLPTARRRARDEAVRWALKEFPILDRLSSRRAGDLSGGERQTLAVARAALAMPQILLVDEPTLGLSPRLATELVGALKRLTESVGMTVILAEQNWQVASRARFVVHLDTGTVRESGSPESTVPQMALDA